MKNLIIYLIFISIEIIHANAGSITGVVIDADTHQPLVGANVIIFNTDLGTACDIDGRFPNHHPDPTVDKNLTDLQNCVLKNRCDVGIAFDGDADRIIAIDEKGQIIRSDILMLQEQLIY